jgi:diketogulonate reductase-like aldo/keto reductase
MHRARVVQGRSFPAVLYGTAWKEDATEGCVRKALAAGFRGIDTANQRKHYFEEGVGHALAAAFAEGSIKRDDLFLQTKFTYARGQDHRLPYDANASFADQVEQSFKRSLLHLNVRSIDSFVLHGPMSGRGLADADHEVWRAMETIQRASGTKLLGISNVSAEQLRALIAAASVKPAFVQNRCYANRGWDKEVREICDEHGVVYQGFSLLTANCDVVKKNALHAIAKRHAATPEQIVFAFALHVGMLPLTGTTDEAHMKLDLAAAEISLTSDEVNVITTLGS